MTTETPAYKVAGDAAKAGFDRFRRFVRKDGAGDSGLASVSELCAVNAAADALVAVALAGTVFFNVKPDQAHARVALYLLTTMAPFALLAPVIGPLLDRFRGRRVALGATMLARAGVCWALAGHTKGLEIFPLALASLMISRGFGIARAAVTPRVLPEGMTLVKANARITVVGVLGGTVMAPLGLGLQQITNVDWVLRLAALIFLFGVYAATQLPPHVDSDHGEKKVALGRATLFGSIKFDLGSLPVALRALMPMRALVGFLTLYLAFELRSGSKGKSALAGLGIAIVAGQAIGLFIGNRLNAKKPELIITVALVVATVSCVAGAAGYTNTVGIVVMGIANLCASIGKLNLDAILQRDIPEDVRTSAFARSETVLQLAWVLGGAFGLIRWGGHAALGVAAAAMLAAILLELGGMRAIKRIEKHGGVIPDALKPPVHGGGGFPVPPPPSLTKTAPVAKPTPPTDPGAFPGGG